MRSTVLAGRKLGIEELDEGIWLVCFVHCDLGYFDLEQKSLQPTDNPFGTRSSPMSPGWTTKSMAETEGFEPSIGLYKPITV